MTHAGNIEAVIFDIGNVLVRFDYYRAANRLIELNGLEELPDRDEIVAAKEALESGRLARDEFLKVLRREFQHTGSDESLVAIWEDIFDENEAMTKVAITLSAHLPVYVLSNISCIHHEYLFRKYPVFSTFRDGVFSYRVGCLKPDPRIYLETVRALDVTPEKTVFIDDLEANIAAAEAAGFIGILYDHEHHTNAEERLRELGLPIGGGS